MYVATPAKNNGESAAAARSWGQRRGVAALGWVRNTQAGAATGPAAPKTTTAGECGRSGMFLLCLHVSREEGNIRLSSRRYENDAFQEGTLRAFTTTA